jgi:hypothetical protein
MRAHTQTIDQRPRIGVSGASGSTDWLYRLYQWFQSLSRSFVGSPPVSAYGTWEPKRERFEPLRADAALDIVISQRGAAWSTQLYNSSL